MYNTKLSIEQIRRNVALPFDDIQSDDEQIIGGRSKIECCTISWGWDWWC